MPVHMLARQPERTKGDPSTAVVLGVAGVLALIAGIIAALLGLHVQGIS